MKLSYEEVKRSVASKSDEELYDMLYVHPDDYTADSVEMARAEFVARKLEAPRLSDLAVAGEESRRREEAPLGWGLRILAFFVSTAFLGIPIMLAHRHYVEQGARQKARDWARWGLFGFLFYFALAIASRILSAVSQ